MKSILIVGGAQGIGKFITLHFAAQGIPLSVAARNQPALEQLKTELSENKSRINFLSIDVTNAQQVSEAFAAHHATFGNHPDIVINTAGVLGPIGYIWDQPITEWELTVKTNLLGSLLVTQQAIKGMLLTGHGSIIHFSGGGSAYARPNFSAYGVSKTGLLRMIENAAEELKIAGYPNIIVNAIAPGAVKTRMTYQVVESGEQAGAKAVKEAEDVIRTGGTPPDQIIALIEFLCDPDKNKGLSGRLIHVRDNYVDFTKNHPNGFPEERGKLRRIPFE